jgi:serine/threonine-protein kinase
MEQAGRLVTLAAGAYRLRQPLAHSAYGVLWRAERAGDGTPVAIKLVNHAQMAHADASQRERWTASAHNEIAFLRALQPWDRRHIVALVDSGEHEALPAMALELLDGDLGRHVAALQAAGGTLPAAQVLDWLAQVNQALGKVHQYGWRHLDLKPGNLLLDASRGALKLADFGTNRPLSDVNEHTYAGTAGWQAPEQFFPTAGQRYRTDARTDYFALGALFYHLASGGERLRHGAACRDAWREHGPGGAAWLRARHGGAQPPVLGADEEALVMRRFAGGDSAHAALLLLRALLAPRPQDRPRHALDISRMIERIRANLPGRASGWRSAA